MDRLEQLKAKYSGALDAIKAQQISVQNLHVQDDKLFIRGKAPSDQAKNRVWDAIKTIDPTYADLTADITVDPSMAPAAPAAQSYTVQAGDTLSKISKQFYGDANKYMKIFEANRGTLTDPNLIKPGQVLTIPAA